MRQKANVSIAAYPQMVKKKTENGGHKLINISEAELNKMVQESVLEVCRRIRETQGEFIIVHSEPNQSTLADNIAQKVIIKIRAASTVNTLRKKWKGVLPKVDRRIKVTQSETQTPGD